jgi:hypothetical protein
MSLRLEAILFNHDWYSATVDAFNIRKNECEYIELPEWRRGVSFKPEDSPAAYAHFETQGNTLTIKVNFSFDGTEERDIRALDANLHREPLDGPDLSLQEVDLFEKLKINSDGNVLGEVTANPVMLNPGETGFQPFELESVRLWDVGVNVEAIVWRWQYRVSGTEDWIDFAITTHRIYTVLNVPKKPWLQDNVPGSTQLPWLDVLDHACVWARGAPDIDEAATRITRHVNDLGRQSVICYGDGSAYYTDVDAFDCSSFLDLLNGELGKGDSVNCDDCAAIVSTFANSVGCDLAQMCIDAVAPKSDFGLKPHRRIGIEGEIKDATFGYHMVAAEGCGDGAEVFDACVEIADGPSIFTAPANLVFSDGKGGYLFRLVIDDDQEITHAQPDCKRRRVGPAAGQSEPRAFRPALEERLRFNSWKESIAPGTRVFFSGFFFARYIASSLKLAALQESHPKALTRSIHSLWTSVTFEGTQPFRIDLYEMESWRDAREGVMKILAAVPELKLEKKPIEEFGDVTFADEAFESILFASGNLVFYLRSLCSKFGSLLNVGRDLNEKILNPPPGAIEPLVAPDAVKRFRFPSGHGLVNSKIRIREEPANSFAPRRLYQFWSETGEVSRENGQLMYRPHSAGNHTLNIFAADEQGNAVQQTLQLFVHG